MSGEAHEGLRSPWLQAGRLAFLALFGVTLLAALAWAFSNVRQIGPENRAVVLRLGALERLAGPGLLLAWPQPLEQVVLLPSAEQVIERRVEGLLRSEQARRADLDVSLSSDALAGSGYLLTGDAGVVQLDVRVFYKVDDPYAYVLRAPTCCRRWTGWWRATPCRSAPRATWTPSWWRARSCSATTARSPSAANACAATWCRASTTAWRRWPRPAAGWASRWCGSTCSRACRAMR